MPIKQQNGDWYWGSKGPFDTKAKAEQVQQAAYASGYKGAIQKFAVFQKEKRYEKNEVEYAPATEGQVKRGQQCSTCYFFQLEEQACLIVEGKIGEDMWCNKWEEQDKIMKEDGGGGGALAGGGTVFTSTNAGIFTPTYGGDSKRRKKKKTGITRLGLFLNDNSPQKKMLKAWGSAGHPPDELARSGKLDTLEPDEEKNEPEVIKLKENKKTNGK